MSRKKQTVKKNKKGKGLLKVVNVDGTLSIVDKKTGNRKTIALSSNKNDNKKQINNFKNNSPKKTKKGIFRKFLNIFRKKSKKNSPPVLTRIGQNSMDRDILEFKKLGLLS